MKNYFFFVFFQEFKTHILVLTRVKFSSPTHVMQFIDTKIKKKFHFFLEKTHDTCIYFIINLQKKYENGGVSSRVLNAGNFAKIGRAHV